MDMSKTTEPVRRLTDQEIADLRADMQHAAEWARQELARRRQGKASATCTEQIEREMAEDGDEDSQ